MTAQTGGSVESHLAAMRVADHGVAHVRIKLASLILGQRLYCVVRDVLLAEGRRQERVAQSGRTV